MPINFFLNACKTVSNRIEFGLCDDPPPTTNPAYIDESNQSIWIAIVKNPNNNNVEFYGIDNCVQIYKANGDMESRCDGLLLHSNSLIFIELKCRAGGKWLQKGREQLTTTINRFKSEYDINDYTKVEAYVCNSLRPLAHTGQFGNIQKFKNDTGLILKGVNVINLP